MLMRLFVLWLFFLFSAGSVSIAAPRIIEMHAYPAANAQLSDFAPWFSVERSIEPNSEQMQPIYLGLTPREMMLRLPAVHVPRLLSFYREIADKEFPLVLRALGRDAADLEVWPTEQDGEAYWAVARWRESSEAEWKWFDADSASSGTTRPSFFFHRLSA
jgi:hypothetical protein